VSIDTRSRWKAFPTRYAVAGLVVLAGAGIALAGLTRQGTDPLSPVAFLPTSLPPGLRHVGSSSHGGDGEGFLAREERFGCPTAPRSSAGPERCAMTVATTSYRVGVIDPNLEGRLSGEAYRSVRVKPAARRITVRGHDGVLEVFPSQRPQGSRQEAQVIALTWIERPGVYVQISGVDLDERQLLETANGLREQ
jgi:hypothetical protein